MAMVTCQDGRSSLERSLVSHVEWSIVLGMLPTMCRAINVQIEEQLVRNEAIKLESKEPKLRFCFWKFEMWF